MQTRLLRLTVLAGLAALAAACGAASTPPSGSSSGSSSGGSPSPSASAAQSGGATIHEASVTVGGTTTMVLTTSAGRTLYYLTSDTATNVKCTGGCLGIWPPLLSSSAPSSMQALSGKLAVATNANGSQVTYNGHPLYLYASDSAAGQANGEGIKAQGGTWHVATPSLSASGSSGGSSGGGGYGY
ncbi:MAG: COG4315 family predicted lipoprotein [Candidatus Dormibacterales bacterium]